MTETKTPAAGSLHPLVRLTPLAQQLYAAMQQGVICCFMPYMGRLNPDKYYFRNDTMKRCTKQAESLLKAGLVEKYDEDWRGHSLRVKPNAPAHRSARTDENQ